MASITERKGIKKNHIYKCIADYKDPFDEKISFKKDELVYGENIDKIDDTNIQFFELVGGDGITHHVKENGIEVIKRRPVEVGDVLFVKFARIKYKLVTVLDVLEDCQMASVYPTSIGFLPLGALCREEHKGWIGVNYDFNFDIPTKVNVKSNSDKLGD